MVVARYAVRCRCCPLKTLSHVRTMSRGSEAGVPTVAVCQTALKGSELAVIRFQLARSRPILWAGMRNKPDGRGHSGRGAAIDFPQAQI